MQLQKQARRGKEIRTQIVKLPLFNPTIATGFEMVAASTIHNSQGVTHIAVTSQPKGSNESNRKHC